MFCLIPAGPIFAPLVRQRSPMERGLTETAKARTRLVLVTPVIEDAVAFAPLLERTCRAGDVAAVILNLAGDDEVLALSAIRILSTHLDGTGAVVLLANLPSLVEAAGADGAHFSDLERLQTSRTNLTAGRLAGVAGLHSRHDAMVASELGVDYVMFGEPDAVGKRPGHSALVERVSWWAEIFQVPCIAFAGSLGEAQQLAQARADFVALGEAVWSMADKAPEMVAQATQIVRQPELAD